MRSSRSVSRCSLWARRSFVVAGALGATLVGFASSRAAEVAADAASAAGAGRLPYDLYLPSTMIGWSFDVSTKFRFDETRGVYVLRSAQAGAYNPTDPRRFKISGADWKHQFGLGPSDGTSAQRATMRFAGSAASSTLSTYPDARDTLLPLDSDAVDGSEEVLLDFEVRVLDGGLRPRLQLTIVRR